MPIGPKPRLEDPKLATFEVWEQRERPPPSRVLDEAAKLTVPELDALHDTLVALERETSGTTMIWLPATLARSLDEVAHATYEAWFDPHADANALVVIGPDGDVDIRLGSRWRSRLHAGGIERAARGTSELWRAGRAYEAVRFALGAIFGERISPVEIVARAAPSAVGELGEYGATYRTAPASAARFAPTGALERLEARRVGLLRELAHARIAIAAEPGARMRSGELGRRIAAAGFRHAGAIAERVGARTLASDYFVSARETEWILARDLPRQRARRKWSAYLIETSFDDGSAIVTSSRRVHEGARGLVTFRRTAGDLAGDVDAHREAVIDRLRAAPEIGVIRVPDLETIARLARVRYRVSTSLGALLRAVLR